MRGSLTFAIVPLALGQVLTWAALFYVHPALLTVWEADLGWSRASVSGAYTASLLVMAVAAPFAGRLIDRQASRLMYTGAIAAGAVLLVLLSLVAHVWQFWAIWIAIGLVNAACLYEAIFAIITVTLGSRAREAITTVTLIAGFATFAAFQSAYWLSEAHGWRATLQIYAAVQLCVSLPLAVIGLRMIEAFREPAVETGPANPRPARTVLRNPVFWLLALAFAAAALAHGMLISHIRPILDDRGVAVTAAVTIASLVGPMQVLGRVIIVTLRNRISTYGAAVVSFLGMAGGAFALESAAMLPILAFIFVVPYGAAYGITSIVRPVLTAEFLGRANFGVIAGMIAVPFGIATAIGPSLSTLLWSLGGYDLVIAIGIVLILGGLAAIMAARRLVVAAGLGAARRP